MEQTVDIFKKLATEGVGGLWEWIKDKLGDFQDMLLGGIKEWVIERVIKGGITWLLSLLNPAAAFIKACKAIYDIVMFIVERGAQILEFVNAVLDSIGAIARGNISAAADKVENALAKALPLAISFLASLLGLGGITEKIREAIDKVRKPIEQAVDFVVLGAVKTFKKMFGGAIGWATSKAKKGAAWVRNKAEAGKKWAAGKLPGAQEHAAEQAGGQGAKTAGEAEAGQSHYVKKVVMNGVEHTVEADVDGAVTMASIKGGIHAKAQRRHDALMKGGGGDPKELEALERIMELADAVKKVPGKHPGKPSDKWAAACDALTDAISDYGQRFDARDIDPVEEGSADIGKAVAAATHVPPKEYSRGKHVQGATDDERRDSSSENGQFVIALTDAEIAELERDTLLTGDLVPRGGGSFHAYKRYPTQIGWDGGKKAFVLRAELSAGSIHSHPRLNR
jgi:hypothetical protein